MRPIAELESRTAWEPIRDTRGLVLKGRRDVRVLRLRLVLNKLHGDVIPVPTSHLNYTRHEPYGVVVQITPWNAPLNTAGWQIAPAICAGNAVVLKPSELTPLTPLALGALCEPRRRAERPWYVIAGVGQTLRVSMPSPIRRPPWWCSSARHGAGSTIAATAARNVVP